MNEQIESLSLEDILDAYVASGDSPDHSLDEWIEHYPQYEKELTEFAVSWTLMESLPSAPESEKVEESVLVLRGMSIVQNLLHKQSQAASSSPSMPFESLIAEARALGMKPRQLAEAVRLGDATLGKLDRRLILYASIPQVAIEELAKVIQRGAASVAAYLQQGRKFAASAEYRSEQAPVLSESEDFFTAVRNDPMISPEHADYWLALERSRDTI